MVTLHRPATLDQPLSSFSRRSLDKTLPPRPQPSAAETTTILVGSKQRSFQVNRQLLCEVSPFFRERLEDPFHAQTISLWLPNESSAMFGLFVEWVHSPFSFRSYLDGVVTLAHQTSERASRDIHWAIIHLHLFASQLSLTSLQDLAMDAIQDLYLEFDWDVSPKLVFYLYTECEVEPAIRLRRWAVAMVAFSLSVGTQPKFAPQDLVTSGPDPFAFIFETLPEFANEYTKHLDNMKAAGHDVRFKNPQLRISANQLRNEERLFGFRECSFHSHRSAVGEGLCPHEANRTPSRAISEPEMAKSRWSRQKPHDGIPRSVFSRDYCRSEKRAASFSQSFTGTVNQFRGKMA